MHTICFQPLRAEGAVVRAESGVVLVFTGQVAGLTALVVTAGVNPQVTVTPPLLLGVQATPVATVTVGEQALPVQILRHSVVALAVQLAALVQLLQGPLLQLVVTPVAELKLGVQELTVVLLMPEGVQVCVALLVQVLPLTTVDTTGPQVTLVEGVQEATSVVTTLDVQLGAPRTPGGKVAGQEATVVGG
ncbi:MAG: hypothetical protein HEQ39_16520 [Rhizobacter sp.]